MTGRNFEANLGELQPPLPKTVGLFAGTSAWKEAQSATLVFMKTLERTTTEVEPNPMRGGVLA